MRSGGTAPRIAFPACVAKNEIVGERLSTTNTRGVPDGTASITGEARSRTVTSAGVTNGRARNHVTAAPPRSSAKTTANAPPARTGPRRATLGHSHTTPIAEPIGST
jgi:hypothetical protein